MKKIYIIVILFFLIFSQNCFAHLRWFVEDEGIYKDVTYQMDWLMLLILLGGAFFVFVCVRLEKISSENNSFYSILSKPYPMAGLEWHFLSFIIAVMLTVNIVQGVFLAPNLILSEGMKTNGMIIQLSVLAMLFVSPLFSGVLLILIILSLPVMLPMELLIDYLFEFVGLALALILISPRINLRDRSLLKKVNVPIPFGATSAARVLRIAIGLQLLVLAVHNKLLDPGMGLVFMEENSFYNFIALMGFEQFTNLHFVFAGGVAESLFGIMLILGISTRFVMLVVAFFFIMTSILTGIHELVGHLPIFSIALIILSYGSRSNLKKTYSVRFA
ncbi:MAG: hypothetical protein GQ546_07700 [Gammaproteobacteria bacterium]|nr:hypothetical protein [Gammaproteobacteria bacterium]